MPTTSEHVDPERALLDAVRGVPEAIDRALAESPPRRQEIDQNLARLGLALRGELGDAQRSHIPLRVACETTFGAITGRRRVAALFAADWGVVGALENLARNEAREAPSR